MGRGVVESLDLFGQGIIKDAGKCIFVENALPGEDVSYQITKERKNYSQGIAVKIHDVSSDRVEPPCPYYWQCGGCCFQHSAYELEATAKENHLTNALRRLGGLDIDGVFHHIDRRSKSYNYRNKVTWHIHNNEIGFYRRNTRDFLPIKKCLLLEAPLQNATDALRDNDLRGIKEVSLRCNEAGKIIMSIQGDKRAVRRLAQEITLPDLVGISTGEAIYGAKYLEMSLGKNKYLLPAGGFFQVNTAAANRLLEQAHMLLVYLLSGGNRGMLLDLYCGVGAVGLYMGDLFAAVRGIESCDESVLAAKENAAINNVDAKFLTAKTENALSEAVNNWGQPQVVIVDPPRNGLHKNTVYTLLELSPPYILYISCDPSTLSRDLNLFSKEYALLHIQPFDLFPRTGHVETVVLMSRNGVENNDRI